jgi:DNA-directed RNA polymerase subunit RPC12/RpoP
MGSLRWDEVEKSVKEGQKQRGGGRRLFVADGESVDVRFIGTENNEPFIYKRHYDVKTQRYLVCAEDQAREGTHDGCVACAVAHTLRGRDARLKSAQRLFAVSLFDPRKYHYIESRPKGEQYQPCTDDESCRWCRKDIERKINGVRHWSMAQAVIDQLKIFERDTLGKRCRRCEKGRITVTGYLCPTCESDLEPDTPDEEIRCISCEKEQKKKPILVKPQEIITCNNCGPKGRRLTLTDAWVTVAKSGERQNTTWNFGKGDVEPFDPEVFLKEFPNLKIQPINFADNPEFAPLPASEMAAILGVRNPFGKGGSDEDEEDDRPRKKRAIAVDDDDEEDVPKKKKKRSVEDDDDEDDTIFD